MVTIVKGKETFVVSRGAFKSIYERQGWCVVKEDNTEKSKVEVEPDSDGEDAYTENENVLESIMEKPISQWTRSEVKHVAEFRNIDISQTKNIAEAKEIIKGFLASIQ